MPLHIICQCCKCNESFSQSLWSIERNHKYNHSENVCEHFDVTIDHESSIDFFGINWRNTIKIVACYRPSWTKKNNNFKNI